MKYSIYSVPMILTLASCAGIAISADTQTQDHACVSNHLPVALTHPDELFKQQLATRLFGSLPVEQQVLIAEADGIGSEGFHFPHEDEARDLPQVAEHTTAEEYLGMLLSDEMRSELSEQQLGVVQKIASLIDQDQEVPAMCFAPGTDSKYAYLVDQMFNFQFVGEENTRYQSRPRWTATATGGGNFGQGEPTVLTYSFAPDGSVISDSGLGGGTSTMFAWLNGLYGSPAGWQPLFHSVFDRWAELTGLSYVWEQNDDGVRMSSSRGRIGVRGDVRIFAFNYPEDGDGGVLAYNFFPNDGDMAFDAFDSFYNNRNGNSLRFRNVTAHEHGHGLGMSHVCPRAGTKLMEPFISVNYDGPQLDDVLNGIRNYGDFAEPNNTRFQATDLGILVDDAFVVVDGLGIDDDSDIDYFRVTVTQSSEIFVRVSPDADEYLQGPQNENCDGGTLTDYNSVEDLQITVLNSAGNVLEISNTSGVGSPELLIFKSLEAGVFYFVIDGADNVNEVQKYELEIGVESVGFINPVILGEFPDAVNPGFTTPFPVTILAQSDIIIPGTEKLFYSTNGIVYQSVDLDFVEGTNYLATIPSAACNNVLDLYISIEGETAGEITFPASGPLDPFASSVRDFSTIFIDNFEDDLGWTVSGNVSGTSSGEWERGTPIGSGALGDPGFDADSSGSAYVTGNAPGNSDVDGGRTILTSPAFEMVNNPEGLISYSRWYDNTAAGVGSNPGEDVFRIEISNNNGNSWTELETVGPDSFESIGGWFHVEFRVADFVTPTNAVRVRFIAEDVGANSVVEAGIDAFLTGERCPIPPKPCPADFTGDRNLDFFDVSAFLSGFTAHNPISDFTNDGVFDFFDISAFLQAFAAGCP